ncbi:hypothetical protein HGP14_27880 [Rhizobium sp. P32RR-XVIII]|uniref:hypothetical protein n=1 Tax=Rhizobium sp. P32RR-XVIII TaxID=2726738 RepID=UPI0014573F9C|nr:hypothetical protein [Rhizobium sp. P32RR-XVIII]NLS07123.1 hypothetical protein [Rhizobium sp. P32RR-XVIII]
MSKATIDFQQFSLAPRRKPATLEPSEALLEVAAGAEAEAADDIRSEPAERDTVLPRLPEDERRRRTAKRAAEQQDTRRRLKSLKRAKDRAIKFYVNVPLEQEMKERLMRAAHENDVKMTVIMQAAIDTYLEDNGY